MVFIEMTMVMVTLTLMLGIFHMMLVMVLAPVTKMVKMIITWASTQERKARIH